MERLVDRRRSSSERPRVLSRFDARVKIAIWYFATLVGLVPWIFRVSQFDVRMPVCWRDRQPVFFRMPGQMSFVSGASTVRLAG